MIGNRLPHFEIIESIKGAAVSALPGYDAAPWGIDNKRYA